MKLLFKKRLNEGMYKITQDILMCDYAGNVVNLMKNKPKEYRILYDSYADVFLVCQADDYIHGQMLEKAITSGAYVQYKDKIEQLENFAEDGFDKGRYSYRGYEDVGQWGGTTIDGKEIGPFLFYMVFSPNREWRLYDDGYDRIYHLTFGDLLTRECELNDIPDLYQMIGKDIEDVEESD